MAVLYWQLLASDVFGFAVPVTPAVNLTKEVWEYTLGFIDTGQRILCKHAANLRSILCFP